MQFVSPAPFSEAVDKLGDKTPIGSELLSDEWSDVPVALRERAFFSSQVENLRFLQRAQDGISDFLESNLTDTPNGPMLATGSRSDFIEQMRGFALSEGMGPLDPSMAGGLRDITSERRLGLIFDTQTRQANDYGFWRQGMNSDVLNEFPAQRFIRVQAVKQERESHQKYENQVYLKTDPIWANVINEDFGVPWGPWAWGCGHDVEDVDRDEAEQLGLVKPGDELEPDSKSFNENLEASTSDIDPDLLDKLKQEFGEQLVIDEDAGTMSWAPADVPEPTPRENPVSDAIDLQVSGTLGEDAQAALSAIDSVHDDGHLPDIDLESSKRSTYGLFKWRRVGAGEIEADNIEVRPTGPWPTLTTVHEVAHFLDLEAIGVGNFGTLAGDRDMAKVLAAAENTGAIKALRAELATTQNAARRGHLEYLLDPREIWARAYSQFIANESGFKSLERDLQKAVAAENNRQWLPQDFAPLGQAIHQMLVDLGWI